MTTPTIAELLKEQKESGICFGGNCVTEFNICLAALQEAVEVLNKAWYNSDCDKIIRYSIEDLLEKWGIK